MPCYFSVCNIAVPHHKAKHANSTPLVPGNALKSGIERKSRDSDALLALYSIAHRFEFHHIWMFTYKTAFHHQNARYNWTLKFDLLPLLMSQTIVGVPPKKEKETSESTPSPVEENTYQVWLLRNFPHLNQFNHPILSTCSLTSPRLSPSQTALHPGPELSDSSPLLCAFFSQSSHPWQIALTWRTLTSFSWTWMSLRQRMTISRDWPPQGD